MNLNSIILSCVMCIGTFRAAAQASFRLENFNSSAGINAPVFDAEGARLSGTNYAAELWGGVTSGSLSPTLNLSGERVMVPAVAPAQRLVSYAVW